MISKKKIRILMLILAVVLLGVAAFLFLQEKFPSLLSPEETNSKNQTVPYSVFYKEVSDGNISSVKIHSDKIEFYYVGSTTKNFTENPDSPLLKEYLLQNNVIVEQSKESSEILSLISDIIFYAFIAVIILVLIKKFFAPNQFKIVRRTGKKFDDIVGMDNLKNDMKQIMQIMHNPAAWAKKGIRMPKGILLEGAPGNGKTLFAKALAGEANVNFIPTKATDFESMFMAIGPMKVKSLFRKARRHAPCIVFIDEFDGIGTKRNYSGSGIETENTRIVTALLNELDGFEPAQGVLVIAATNNIQALDEALIRPGRFDARFTVPYPDQESIKQLIQMYSQGKAFVPECTVEKLAVLFKDFSCAKIESVLNRAALISSQKQKTAADLSDINDAMKEQQSAK